MAVGTRRRDTDEAAAVLAARSPLIVRFMTTYMRRYARQHFYAVRLAHGGMPVFDPACGVIVYSNHPSWWDPVVFVLLQAHVFPRRAGYGPMDAAALGRYRVMRRIGIFGLEPGTRRGAARFLRVGASILQRPDNVLWVTAEGGFTDPRRRPVRLRPGVAHLLRNHPNVVAIPLALEFPFWNERAPEALARFGEPVMADARRDVAEWSALLAERLTATMDRLAEDAMSRDPSRFQNVVVGRAGIGGIYDVWRRARAMLSGQRLQLEHDPAGPDLAGHPQAGGPAP